jgi:hypothetical protein
MDASPSIFLAVLVNMFSMHTKPIFHYKSRLTVGLLKFVCYVDITCVMLVHL